MFFRRSRPSMSDLYEARIADLKEAHEARVRELMRLVDALAEQIEYLRAVGGTAHVSRRVPSTPGLATTLPPESGHPLHMSEEEEDLLAMAEHDLISEIELEQLREQIAEQLGPGVLIS